MKRGFTIIELLVVIAVIAVLMTIVAVAATGSIRSARAKRAAAMATALEQGIAAYYAQEGEWPRNIEQKLDSMESDTYTFTGPEADGIFQDVVGHAYGKGSGKVKSALVDASALFVARSGSLGNSGQGCFDNHGNRRSSTYCGDKGCKGGVDFSLAANRNGKDYIPFNQMAFGYQGPENGKFCRFWVTYNARTDAVSVNTKKP